MGCGNSSVGSSICGYGDAATTLSVDTKFLPNPYTGAVMDAPLLSVVGSANMGGTPVLDLTFDANMNLQGMNSIDQQVVLAIGTIIGTAINPNVGSDIFAIQTINPDNYQSLVEDMVNDALNLLISNDCITLNSVSAVVDQNVSSRGNITIVYTNNKSNIKTKLSI